uniref:sialic acid-binding Ig-like lectin 13 isoform X2 n=1 Tax=Pristiophorus japonicus TaxID=55135 RepID=UPI00398E3737
MDYIGTFIVCTLLQAVSGEWSLEVPQEISAVRGSCVVIPCAFHCPQNLNSSRMAKIWYKGHDSAHNVIFHSTKTGTVREDFCGRTYFLMEWGNCTLEIKNISASDQDDYLFRVEVTAEPKSTYTYRNSKVRVNVSDRPDKVVVPVPKKMVEGIPAQVNCKARFSCFTRPPIINWTDPSANFSQALTPSEYGQYSAVMKFVPSYADDGRSVRCQVYYPDLNRTTQAGVTLSVNYPPRNTSVVVSRSGSTPQDGGNVSLSCRTDSRPEPHRYTWFRVERGKNTTLSAQNKTLRLAGDPHLGSYFCRVTNTIGSDTSPSTSQPCQDKVLDEGPLKIIITVFGVFALIIIVGVIIVYVRIHYCWSPSHGLARSADVHLEPGNPCESRHIPVSMGPKSLHHCGAIL